MSRSLAHSSSLNLAGQIIPLFFALFAIPRIIEGLGTERFGLLSLAWLITGYFSLFDLGLGRALTQVVAARRSTESAESLSHIVWSALLVMIAMGAIGGLLAAGIAPWLSHTAFNLSEGLIGEARNTFYLLAVSIPVVIVSAGLVGVLTAYDRFGTINLIRLPLGITNFLVPLAALQFSHSISIIVALLIATRALAALAQLLCCFQVLPELKRNFGLRVQDLPPLLRVGGWMTVSNVVGPLMMYLDRFLIGAVLSVAAVAYYATPYEMVTKILIIPAAITTSMFPMFARARTGSDAELTALFVSGLNGIFAIVLPGIVVLTVFAPQLLQWWLGAEFAAHSALTTQLLAIGIFLNSLAQLPFAFVQGRARADLTAKAHLAELVFYLPLLWFGLRNYGLPGAAAVWSVRAAADCVILFLLSCRLSPGLYKGLAQPFLGIVFGTAMLIISLTLSDLVQRLLVSLLLFSGIFIFFLMKMFTSNERQLWASRFRLSRFAR